MFKHDFKPHWRKTLPILSEIILISKKCTLIEGSRKDVFTCCLREVGPDQLGSLLLIALLRDVTCQKKKRQRRLLLVPSLLFNGAKQQNGMDGTTEECNRGRVTSQLETQMNVFHLWVKHKAAVEEKVTYHIVLTHSMCSTRNRWCRLGAHKFETQSAADAPVSPFFTVRSERHETCWLASLQNNRGRLRWRREVSNVVQSVSDSKSSHKTDSLQYAAATRERQTGRVRHARSQEFFWREKAWE